MAGYDPRLAIPFWERMSQQGGNTKSELFSDHPSDAKRMAALQKRMPEALKYYNPPVSAPAQKSTTTTKKTTTAKKTTTTKKK